MVKTRKMPKIIMAIVATLALLCGLLSLSVASVGAEEAAPAVKHLNGGWYDIAYSDESIKVVFNENFDTKLSEDGSKLFGHLIEAAKEVVISNVLGSVEVPGSTVETAADEPDEDFWKELDSSKLKEFRQYVVDRLSDPDELEVYTSGGYDILLRYAIGTYIEENSDGTTENVDALYTKINEAIEEVVEEAIDNAIDALVEKEAREGILKENPDFDFNSEAGKAELATKKEAVKTEKKDEFDNKRNGWKNDSTSRVTEASQDVKENGGKAPAPSGDEIIAAIRGLYLDGKEVYSKEHGKLRLRTVLDLLPSPAELKDKTNLELNNLLSIPTKVETTYGDVNFNFEFGFVSNGKIQEKAKLLDDHFGIDISGNNFTANVKFPASLADVYKDFLTTNIITDSDRQNILSLLFISNKNEQTTYKYSDFVDYVVNGDEHNFKTWINSSKALNEYAAKLGDNVKAYDVVSAAVRLARNFLATDKESALMYHHYDGNGVFNYDKTDAPLLSPETAGRYLEKFLGNLGTELNIDNPKGLFDPDDLKFDFDISVEIPGIYSVNYIVNGKTVVEGLLPAGVSLENYAPEKNKSWFEQDTSVRISTMPNRDVTLYQVTEGHVLDGTKGAWQYNGKTFADNDSIMYNGKPHDEFAYTLSDHADLKFDYHYYAVGENGELTKLDSAPVDVGSYKVQAVAPDGYGFNTDTNTYRLFKIVRGAVSAPSVGTLTPFKKELKKQLGQVEPTEEGKEPEIIYVTYYVWAVEPDIASSPLYSEVAVEGTFEAVRKGTYEITYVFMLNDKANYYFDKTNVRQGDKVSADGTQYTMTLKWTAPEDLPGEPYVNNGVTITDSDDTIPDGYDLNVTQTTEVNLNKYKKQITEAYPDKIYRLGIAYEIHFENDDGLRLESYNGSFHVIMPIPEQYRDEKFSFAVLHIKDDGTMDIIDGVKRVGDNVEFDTNSFSIYALVSLEDAPAAAGMWWLIALIIVLALLIILAIILFILRSKDPEPEDIEDEPAEETSEEEVQEEENNEEQQQPAEQPAEEPAEPAAEPADETTATVVLPPEVETRTVLNRSFMAKLSQADDEVKENYSDIKNHFLQYKKVRGRTSWKYDAFNIGREKLGKLVFSGAGLYLYLAIDPDTLDPKYHHKSVKDKARYAAIPTKLRVKSKRSIKYALELIDLVMAEHGIELRNKFQPVDYTIPYMTDEQLIENEMIKVKTTTGPRSFGAPKQQ